MANTLQDSRSTHELYDELHKHNDRPRQAPRHGNFGRHDSPQSKSPSGGSPRTSSKQKCSPRLKNITTTLKPIVTTALDEGQPHPSPHWPRQDSKKSSNQSEACSSKASTPSADKRKAPSRLKRSLKRLDSMNLVARLQEEEDEKQMASERRFGAVISNVSFSPLFDSGNSGYSDEHYLIRWQRGFQEILKSQIFDAVIGVVIVTNSILIGVEQTFKLQGQDTTLFKSLESVFISIYIVELAMRFFAFRWQCLHDNWVKFDLLLVTFGVITTWILTPLFGSEVVDTLGPVMVLRGARLFRLAKTLRLLLKFRELWMLVRGLLNSASTMLYTMVLVSIILYIFSAMAIELITNHRYARGPEAREAFSEHVEAHFSSIGVTMLTLMQFVTLDNIVLVYKPLIDEDMTLAVYFFGLILIVGIVLMNLITAVIVNGALEQAMQDKDAMKFHEDKQRKKLIKELRKVFLRLDEDSSGQLSKDEIVNINEEDKQIFNKLMTISDPLEVFMALDVDGSGEIDIEEFCDGIWQVAVSKAPIEIKKIEKQVSNIREHQKAMVESQDHMQKQLQMLLDAQLRGNLATYTERGPPSGSQTPSRAHTPRNCQSPRTATSHAAIRGAPSWAEDFVRMMTAEQHKLRCSVLGSLQSIEEALTDKIVGSVLEPKAQTLAQSMDSLSSSIQATSWTSPSNWFHSNDIAEVARSIASSAANTPRDEECARCSLGWRQKSKQVAAVPLQRLRSELSDFMVNPPVLPDGETPPDLPKLQMPVIPKAGAVEFTAPGGTSVTWKFPVNLGSHESGYGAFGSACDDDTDVNRPSESL